MFPNVSFMTAATPTTANVHTTRHTSTGLPAIASAKAWLCMTTPVTLSLPACRQVEVRHTATATTTVITTSSISTPYIKMLLLLVPCLLSLVTIPFLFPS